MLLDLNSVKPDPEKAEAEITSVVTKAGMDGPETITGAFGTRTDNGDLVFIGGKCASSIHMDKGDVVDLTMCINDKWQEGKSDCKWYAFYAHVAPKPDVYSDLFAEADTSVESFGDRTSYVKRKAELRRCEELIDAGGVWNTLKLTNSVCGASYVSTTDMTGNHKALQSSISAYLNNRHVDGTIARIDIRQRADQTKASWVFFTTMPEKFTQALKGAK